MPKTHSGGRWKQPRPRPTSPGHPAPCGSPSAGCPGRRAVTGSAPSAGVYRREEAHLLLKAFQIRGSVDVFVSKFENDNWGLDGYVSTACEAGHALEVTGGLYVPGRRGVPKGGVCQSWERSGPAPAVGPAPGSVATPLASWPLPWQHRPHPSSVAPPTAVEPAPGSVATPWPRPHSTAPPHHMAVKPCPVRLSLQGTRRGLRHTLCPCRRHADHSGEKTFLEKQEI